MAKTKAKVQKVQKVEKVIFGLGETKNIGNFESLKVYNELEANVLEGEKVSDVQKKLREMVVQLNERDFNELLKK